MKTNPLVGKTITGLEIAKDKMSLRFVLSDGDCIVNCDADCCSHTWIEHIELPALGFPAVVIAVDDLGMDRQEEDDDGCVKFYGCKVTTDRGEIVIDYRNSSNGYYGGDLSWPHDDYYGGVHGQNLSEHEWQPVTSGL